MKNLAGKVAFITGAAGGIGLAIAKSLAEHDVHLVLADIDRDELERAAACRDHDRNLVGYPRCGEQRQLWYAAREATEKRFGVVDVLNTAGISPSPFELADRLLPQNFERALGINLMGVFNGIHCFGASMRSRRCGHIVNTASTAALVSIPARSDYSISKCGGSLTQ